MRFSPAVWLALLSSRMACGVCVGKEGSGEEEEEKGERIGQAPAGREFSTGLAKKRSLDSTLRGQ